jgi:hypothetical protein
METHDPKKVIERLQIILSNPEKKIGFLFGAGVSAKDKNEETLILTSQEIIDTVVCQFSGEMKCAIDMIKDEIRNNNEKFNIEALLSKISEKERAVGSEMLCGLDKPKIIKLREKIEDTIKGIVSVHTALNFEDRELNHNDFAKWIKNANRKIPVEIFTTNYDYLLEYGLEQQKIPYFDGFIGSNRAFFYPEWIEDSKPINDWTKLWKLHGSLGWSLVKGSIKGSSLLLTFDRLFKHKSKATGFPDQVVE